MKLYYFVLLLLLLSQTAVNQPQKDEINIVNGRYTFEAIRLNNGAAVAALHDNQGNDPLCKVMINTPSLLVAMVECGRQVTIKPDGEADYLIMITRILLKDDNFLNGR